MLATYSHLVNSDVDKILLTRAGIITEDERNKDNALNPRQCPHCGKVHTPTTKFCNDCGTALTKEAQATQEQAVSVVDAGMIKNAQDPAFIDAVAKRMIELQTKKR